VLSRTIADYNGRVESLEQ
jgi:chromosome segregation ATPase